MSNDDQLDEQLRRMAERSMERRAAVVDTDAALSDHQARLDRPRTSEDSGRRWLAAAAAVGVVAAGIAAIAWARDADAPNLVATETVATSPSTTELVSTTTAPPNATTTTASGGTTGASASPGTVRAGETVGITPAGSVQRTCLDIATLVQTGAGQPLTVGQIVGGDWVPAPGAGAPVTYPACLGTTSDESVSVTVPANVPAGEYDLCITEPANPAGCATITIIEPVATDHASTPPEPVRRPVFDPEICEADSALEGDSIEQPVVFFAKPSEFPVPLQVFADPDLGAAGPIVMVMRFRDRPDDAIVGSGVDENVVELTNTSIRIRVLDDGTGEATWTADDGTTGYLRSRNVDTEGLAKTILTATVREQDAPIPGFDFFSNQEQEITTNINGQLELTAEAMNTDLPGSFRTTECTVQSTGFVYRTTVLDGGAVLRVAAVLDRPAPLEVGQFNDSVIIINGNPSEAAPSIEDLRNATDLQWDALLDR